MVELATVNKIHRFLSVTNSWPRVQIFLSLLQCYAKIISFVFASYYRKNQTCSPVVLHMLDTTPVIFSCTLYSNTVLCLGDGVYYLYKFTATFVSFTVVV